MKIQRDNFSYLKWALLSFSLALLMGSVGLLFGQQKLGAELINNARAQQNIAQLSAQIVTAESQLTDQKNYQQDYQLLLDKNIIGDENRLALVEALEKINRSLKLGQLSYTITPQQDFVNTLALDSGHFIIHQSAITLQFSVANEPPLFDLLAALNTDIPGQFLLQQCAITRPVVVEAADSQAPLAVDCGGAWLTFKHRAES
jgi:hypothetical protein